MRNQNPKYTTVSGCPRSGLSRRRFISGCAACAGAAGLMGAPAWLRSSVPSGKTRIRMVHALHGPVQEGPDWPNKGFDFRPFMERTYNDLAKRFPDYEFLPVLAAGPEQAQKIVADDAKDPADGYLTFQLNCWNRVVQTLAATGKPVLYADFQYGGSGGFLVYTAGFLRAGAKNLGFVASSNFDDLAAAVKCFAEAKAGGPGYDFAAAVARVRAARTSPAAKLSYTPDVVKLLSVEETIRLMKASKIVAVRSHEAGTASTLMGIPVIQVPFAEVNEAWAAADKSEARAIADRWQKTAALIEGVSRAELENSAAMYLGEKAVLKKHGANAITMNCLGGFYGGHIHAYPCLGFHELNNENLVGGCECDVPSAAAMVTVAAMTGGRPGFISDPVVDTAKRQIIYAHCVASNKVFGPKGPVNPFQILTHSEDRQGASVRSLMPPGYLTTTIELSEARKEILFHQAKAAGNDLDDRACRTKLAAEPVGDIEKLFTMWDTWGWHRVTVYGDLKKPLYALADAIGWKVVEEA